MTSEAARLGLSTAVVVASSSLGSTHCSTTTQPLYTATTSTGDTALHIRIMALKLHLSFLRKSFHVGNLSIISKMDENRSLGELGTGIKMFKERPPLEPRPVLASSGCHDPGQPPPPTRGQLCMTEPSPALTSIQPFPFSNFFHASTSFFLFRQLCNEKVDSDYF